jgi:hypothetical protein
MHDTSTQCHLTNMKPLTSFHCYSLRIQEDLRSNSSTIEILEKMDQSMVMKLEDKIKELQDGLDDKD